MGIPLLYAIVLLCVILYNMSAENRNKPDGIIEETIAEGVKLYLWDADKSILYPPTDELSSKLPYHYMNRYRDSKNESRKQQAIGSGVLLYKILGIKKDDYFPIGPHGKIEINNISISHSKSVTALAIGETTIGVDIEHIRKASNNVVNKFFPKEFREEYLDELKNAELVNKDMSTDIIRDELFTVFWTRLEASLKADGRGLSVPRDEIQSVISNYTIITKKRDGLIISVAISI